MSLALSATPLAYPTRCGRPGVAGAGHISLCPWPEPRWTPPVPHITRTSGPGDGERTYAPRGLDSGWRSPCWSGRQSGRTDRYRAIYSPHVAAAPLVFLANLTISAMRHRHKTPRASFAPPPTHLFRQRSWPYRLAFPLIGTPGPHANKPSLLGGVSSPRPARGNVAVTCGLNEKTSQHPSPHLSRSSRVCPVLVCWDVRGRCVRVAPAGPPPALRPGSPSLWQVVRGCEARVSESQGIDRIALVLSAMRL